MFVRCKCWNLLSSPKKVQLTPAVRAPSVGVVYVLEKRLGIMRVCEPSIYGMYVLGVI